MNVIADLFQRELWTMETIRKSNELKNLLNSRIINSSDSEINMLVQHRDKGTTIEIPYVQQQGYVEPNVSNDSNEQGTIRKIVKEKVIATIVI